MARVESDTKTDTTDKNGYDASDIEIRKRNKNSHLREIASGYLVEAAGIEPASRDISTLASTCVFDSLSFAHCPANRQAEQRTSRKLVLTLIVPGMNQSDPELVTGFQGSPEKPFSRSYRLLGSHSQVVVGK